MHSKRQKQVGMTQQQVAEFLGISRTEVYKYEKRALRKIIKAIEGDPGFKQECLDYLHRDTRRYGVYHGELIR